MSNLTLFTSSHNAQVLPSFYNEKLISIYLDTSFKNTVGIFLITVTIASTNNFGSTIVNLKFTEDNPSTSITMIFQIDIAQKYPNQPYSQKCQKKVSWRFWCYRIWLFKKVTNSFYFQNWLFWHFWAIYFSKEIWAGKTRHCDIQPIWQICVWC